MLLLYAIGCDPIPLAFFDFMSEVVSCVRYNFKQVCRLASVDLLLLYNGTRTFMLPCVQYAFVKFNFGNRVQVL